MDLKNWDAIADCFADRMGLSDGQRRRLRDNRSARLIAEVPYLAGCENPGRTAFAHLSGLFIAARMPEVFGHRPSDTLSSRMSAIANFDGGDAAIIERGMKLLELVSLADHCRDAEFDRARGKYNPVNAGDVDPERGTSRLKREIIATACPQMDAIMTPEQATTSWWFDVASIEVDGVEHQQSA